MLFLYLSNMYIYIQNISSVILFWLISFIILSVFFFIIIRNLNIKNFNKFIISNEWIKDLIKNKVNNSKINPINITYEFENKRIIIDDFWKKTYIQLTNKQIIFLYNIYKKSYLNSLYIYSEKNKALFSYMIRLMKLNFLVVIFSFIWYFSLINDKFDKPLQSQIYSFWIFVWLIYLILFFSVKTKQDSDEIDDINKICIKKIKYPFNDNFNFYDNPLLIIFIVFFTLLFISITLTGLDIIIK